MVIVQSGRAYVQKTYIDPATARADTYCMSAVGATCQYALPKLKRDAANAFLHDANGKPIIDTDVIVEKKKDIVDWQENNLGFNTVGSVQTVLTADKDWSISIKKANLVDKSANLPAVVVTYIGQGSYLNDKHAEFKALISTPPVERSTEESAPVSSRDMGQRRWVSFEDIKTGADLFEQTSKLKAGKSAEIGDTLRSLQDLKLYARPASWASSMETLKKGSVVIVSSVQTLSDTGNHLQKWVELESSGRDRGLNDVPVIAKKANPKLAERIWCVHQQLNGAFEIGPSMSVRSLTSRLSGRASKGKNGLIYVDLTSEPELLPGIALPFPSTYNLIINKKGRLMQKITSSSISPVGVCTSVSDLMLN